jgi:hypothetical protein
MAGPMPFCLGLDSNRIHRLSAISDGLVARIPGHLGRQHAQRDPVTQTVLGHTAGLRNNHFRFVPGVLPDGPLWTAWTAGIETSMADLALYGLCVLSFPATGMRYEALREWVSMALGE